MLLVSKTTPNTHVPLLSRKITNFKKVCVLIYVFQLCILHYLVARQISAIIYKLFGSVLCIFNIKPQSPPRLVQSMQSCKIDYINNHFAINKPEYQIMTLTCSFIYFLIPKKSYAKKEILQSPHSKRLKKLFN